MALTPRNGKQSPGGVAERLGVIEQLLGKSSVAKNLRLERQREEEAAAREADAILLEADATERRAAALAAWVPAMSAYRKAVEQAIADLDAAAAEVARVCQADEDARADLVRAHEMRAERQRFRVAQYHELDSKGQPTYAIEERIVGQPPHVAPVLPRLGAELIPTDQFDPFSHELLQPGLPRILAAAIDAVLKENR